MPVDSRGQVVHSVSSNRAPLAIDATNVTLPYVSNVAGTVLGSGLLAAAGQKVLSVNNMKAQPAVAQAVVITNRSGQPANLTLTVARTGFTKQDLSTGGTLTVPPTTVDTLFPIYVAAGDVLTLNLRVTKVVETNAGAGAQTGLGVCYVFILEPSDH